MALYPKLLLQLQGSKLSTRQNPYQTTRSRHQITGDVVVLTLLTSVITSTITGTATGLTLQQEINKKMAETQAKINDRFNSDEKHLQELS